MVCKDIYFIVLEYLFSSKRYYLKYAGVIFKNNDCLNRTLQIYKKSNRAQKNIFRNFLLTYYNLWVHSSEYRAMILNLFKNKENFINRILNIAIKYDDYLIYDDVMRISNKNLNYSKCLIYDLFCFNIIQYSEFINEKMETDKKLFTEIKHIRESINLGGVIILDGFEINVAPILNYCDIVRRYDYESCRVMYDKVFYQIYRNIIKFYLGADFYNKQIQYTMMLSQNFVYIYEYLNMEDDILNCAVCMVIEKINCMRVPAFNEVFENKTFLYYMYWCNPQFIYDYTIHNLTIINKINLLTLFDDIFSMEDRENFYNFIDKNDNNILYYNQVRNIYTKYKKIKKVMYSNAD